MQLDEISLNEIKRDIALVTLNIENLGDANKEMAILHLKETIDLLQMSSQNKRVKLQEDYDAKESPEKKIKLPLDEEEYSLTKSLYRGKVPSCDLCSSTFVTVGALDNHMKSNHGDIKQEESHTSHKPWLSSQPKINLIDLKFNWCLATRKVGVVSVVCSSSWSFLWVYEP